MELKFKTIVLMGRQATAEAAATLCDLIAHLQPLNLNLLIEQETLRILPDCKLPTIQRDQLKNNCDLIIVVGGDGSLLNAANAAATQNIPVVGVNRGFLGFLTDIPPHNINKLDALLAGDYHLEHRFLLDVSTQNGPAITTQNLVLNDVVLLSSITSHMIEFSVLIDNQFVCDYRADGLIIATPTGSTAHALSGGGPILHPDLNAIVLVPMFSHNLSSRPIVVKNSSVIRIVINKNNHHDCRLSCDGQVQVFAAKDGEIHVKMSQHQLQLLHPLDYNYFETLRTKLHWEKG